MSRPRGRLYGNKQFRTPPGQLNNKQLKELLVKTKGFTVFSEDDGLKKETDEP